MDPQQIFAVGCSFEAYPRLAKRVSRYLTGMEDYFFQTCHLQILACLNDLDKLRNGEFQQRIWITDIKPSQYAAHKIFT